MPRAPQIRLNDGRTFETCGQRCPHRGVAAEGSPLMALWPTASTALPWFEGDRDLILGVTISTARGFFSGTSGGGTNQRRDRGYGHSEQYPSRKASAPFTSTPTTLKAQFSSRHTTRARSVCGVPADCGPSTALWSVVSSSQATSANFFRPTTSLQF